MKNSICINEFRLSEEKDRKGKKINALNRRCGIQVVDWFTCQVNPSN